MEEVIGQHWTGNCESSLSLHSWPEGITCPIPVADGHIVRTVSIKAIWTVTVLLCHESHQCWIRRYSESDVTCQRLGEVSKSCSLSNSQAGGWLNWFQKDVWLHVGLWENEPSYSFLMSLWPQSLVSSLLRISMTLIFCKFESHLNVKQTIKLRMI